MPLCIRGLSRTVCSLISRFTHKSHRCLARRGSFVKTIVAVDLGAAFAASDNLFGRRIITMGGGLCGFSGQRAPSSPPVGATCDLIVSAPGGTRGGALYALSLVGTTYSTIVTASVNAIWPTTGLAATDDFGSVTAAMSWVL